MNLLREEVTSGSLVYIRWINTSRKQARVRGYSARRIGSIRAIALENRRRNSMCSPFSSSMVAVKQYESKSLHSSLCNLGPVGVRLKYGAMISRGFASA
jgi:hypothetical protein